MAAVATIAAFYTASLNIPALLGALLVFGAMLCLNRGGVHRLWIYWLGFTPLWYLMLLSGVHATIAGVLAALTIPIKPTPAASDAEDSPLHRLEHGLHPWIAYGIVPLFGFVNAGVTLGEAEPFAPLPLGIAAAPSSASSCAYPAPCGRPCGWALPAARSARAGLKSMAFACCAASALP